MTLLLRLRVVLVTLMMMVVGVTAGDIFGRLIPSLLIAPLVLGALSMLPWRWPLRLLASAAGVVASTAVIVVLNGGDGSDIATAFGAGPQRLLTSDWPSPDLPDLIGTIAASLGVATMLAALAARRASLHLSPLVPVIGAYAGMLALSAPVGLRPIGLAVLGALAIALAAVRPDRETHLRELLTLLSGERRLLPIAALSIGIATLAAIPLALPDRADPRRNEPATRSAALLDPIEATLALRAIDPPIALHEIAISSTREPIVPPVAWRTAALVEYDGQRWEPDLTLRPIGNRLGESSVDTIDASISFLASDLQLVPLPGAPVTVNAAIETDAARNAVVLTERPTPGVTIAVAARPEPSSVAIDAGELGVRELDEGASRLTELAGLLAEEGGADTPNVLDQLRAIETTMRTDFVLREDANGGGLQRALIDRFLRDTQRGNTEQFATAYVLLARSLGVDARVATGFRVDPTSVTILDGVATMTLTSADATIWPEVRVGEAWVAFDPVPEQEAGDTGPPPLEPQVQTPAAPQPPIDPPPESTEEPVVTETDGANTARAGLPVVVIWVLRTAAVAGALLVPLLLAILWIIGMKWRRRRRHLSGPAVDRIRGAWNVATNRLVDAGLAIDRADTNNEIADDAEVIVPAAHRELHRLATLASATTFGSPARPDLLADDAVFCLDHVERSIAASLTTMQRFRWMLSVRSLRSRTRSPV